MNIQSLSVCVSGSKCINNCKFCCVKMHKGEEELYPTKDIEVYNNQFAKRMEFARDNGCNTVILTGEREPQQNMNFIKKFVEINDSLSKPFRNIEMQTTGAFLDDAKLEALDSVNTMAISVSCLNNDEINRGIIGTTDKNLCLDKLCKKIKEHDYNLRLCLNVTNFLMSGKKLDVNEILDRCEELGADQVTFRKMYCSNSNCEQDIWIAKNVSSEIQNEFFDKLYNKIKTEGKYLDTLEYGADRYDYKGLSLVIDDDCMAKKTNKNAMKYLILRPNGKLYSKWDSKASLIF